MKKLLISTLMLSFFALSANAEVDKFVSSTIYDVKTSPIAQMMENATKRAMKNNNRQKQNVQNVQNRQQRYQNQYQQQQNNQQNNYRKTTSGWS